MNKVLDAEDRERSGVTYSLQPAIEVSLIWTDPDVIALIDNRRLERECFVRSVEGLHPGLTLLSYATADDYIRASVFPPRASAILFNVGSRQLSHPEVRSELQVLLGPLGNGAPVVVLGPSDDLDQMIDALDCGAAGYVPSSFGIQGIVESTRLAALGGVFLRTESLAKLREGKEGKVQPAPQYEEFTARQAAVADALRRGKPNKRIAYELNMCESTVKVHVRKIMCKLNCANRTEAALKLNTIFSRAAED